jgi:hypothetical protein
MARDSRRVQTAVLDHADSEEPVELPMDPVGLTLFLQAHPERTFWCGLWLRGCGGRLTTRLCTEKVCHFAHVPNPNAPDSPCRRTSSKSSGSGSADHLYIKAAIKDWMAGQGLTGEAHIPRDPSGESWLGAQVTAEPKGHQPMRFILDSSALPDPSEIGSATILGPDVDPGPRLLHELGYINRVRCVPEGSHRKVQIGTQRSGGRYDWYDFTPDNVQLLSDGLSTPAVEEVRRQRSHTVPIGVRQGSRTAAPAAPLRPVATPSDHPVDRSVLAEDLRQALADHSSLTPLQRCLNRLEEATRQGATAEETELIRQASDTLLLLRRGVGAQAPAAVKRSGPRKPKRLPLVSAPTPVAERSVAPVAKGPRQERQARRAAVREVRNVLQRLAQPEPLTDAEMQQMVWDLATALDAAGDWLSPSERRKARAWIDRPTQPEATSTPHDRSTPVPDSLRSAASAVRGALKKTARAQTTTNWATLRRQLGSALPSMTSAERITVLILVDQQTPKDQPLLSSLIAAGDPGMAASYREVAASLGLDVPTGDNELRDVLEADVQQVHRHWLHQ